MVFTSPKGFDVEMTIVRGKDLAAKDRHLLTRQRVSSDPYVEVYLGLDQPIGRTKTISRNLNPEWNATFHLHLPNRKGAYGGTEEGDNAAGIVFLKIYDEDVLTDPDIMGTLIVPIPAVKEAQTTQKWYSVDSLFAPNAKGEVEITLQLTPIYSGPLACLFPEGGLVASLAPSPQTVARWTEGTLRIFRPKKNTDGDEGGGVQEEYSTTPTRREYIVALVEVFYKNRGPGGPDAPKAQNEEERNLFSVPLSSRKTQDTENLVEYLTVANKVVGGSLEFTKLLSRYSRK